MLLLDYFVLILVNYGNMQLHNKLQTNIFLSNRDMELYTIRVKWAILSLDLMNKFDVMKVLSKWYILLQVRFSNFNVINMHAVKVVFILLLRLYQFTNDFMIE